MEARLEAGRFTGLRSITRLSISIQDVLYTVCNPIGSVLRIVIFKRNGIQAMVEYPSRVSVYVCMWGCVVSVLIATFRFESVQCAQKAKAALNGADIYAGCCTLKIEYARVRHAQHISKE